MALKNVMDYVYGLSVGALCILVASVMLVGADGVASAAPEPQGGPITWSPPLNLSDTGAREQETEPKMAADRFGDVHVFWTGRLQEGSTAIYYAKRSADGLWEAPRDVIVGDQEPVSYTHLTLPTN